MGISLHSTTFRKGTVANTVRYLTNECVTGTLSLSFGRHFQSAALVYFVNGQITAAEFGDVKREQVLDVLLCQEQSLSELNFLPGREANYAFDKLIQTKSVTDLLAKVSTDVASCEARPWIYGRQSIDINGKQVDSVLHMLFAFDQHKTALESVQLGSTDYEAPLPQCALIRGGLKRDLLLYHNLVPLEAIKDLVRGMKEQPTAEESEYLSKYLPHLLPHEAASHMPLERFYAFASALEAIADRIGADVGENARQTIKQIIRKYGTK